MEAVWWLPLPLADEIKYSTHCLLQGGSQQDIGRADVSPTHCATGKERREVVAPPFIPEGGATGQGRPASKTLGSGQHWVSDGRQQTEAASSGRRGTPATAEHGARYEAAIVRLPDSRRNIRFGETDLTRLAEGTRCIGFRFFHHGRPVSPATLRFLDRLKDLVKKLCLRRLFLDEMGERR